MAQLLVVTQMNSIAEAWCYWVVLPAYQFLVPIVATFGNFVHTEIRKSKEVAAK